MSDNWVVQNLQNALDTWNKYLTEIWQLITQSPEQFKGGTIWSVIVNIHDAVRAIGLALLVLFFVVGVMKTCGSFAEVKKPEHALKLFIRFAVAKGVVHLWAGIDDGSVQHRTGAGQHHYERFRLRLRPADSFAAGDYRRGRKLWFL